MALTTAAPAPGFADPATQSASSFRAVLDAMARPGRIHALHAALKPPRPLHPTTAALLLTLVDFDTALWIEPGLRSGAVADYLRFHCAAPLVEEPGEADFVLVADPAARPPFALLKPGTPDYPDRSATLLMQVDALTADAGVRLSGPGIETVHTLSAPPLEAAFWREMAASNARFPLGVDAVFCAPREIAAVPRSTIIADQEAG